ncbi:MAG: hypothetical protein WKF96_03345 [Solirubrobacteraceae bacterium]
MPRRQVFEISVVGDGDSLEQVAGRLRNAQPAFEDALDILERGEERHFARLRGQYVRSGALKQSLTGQSPASIREIQNDGAEFGTNLFYAQFQVKRRKAPEAGQVRKRNGKGKSAVLVLQPKAKKEIVQTLLDYVVEPFGDDID